LPKLVYYYEEPYADTSAIPTWYLAEMSRKYVTVALNGDGGDENFAGYDRYFYYKLMIIWQKIPKILKKKIFQISKILAKSKINFFKKTLKFSENYIIKDPEKNYLNLICFFNNLQKERILSENFKKKIKKIDSEKIVKEKFDLSNVKDYLDRVFFADINSYLPDCLLPKVDIASMVHSLEIRSPFLDHQFLELTAKIPSNLKLKGQKNKYIFKKTVKNLLPKEILSRKKMGFGLPLKHWFRKELKDYLREILLSQKAINRGLFNKNYVEKLIIDHKIGKENYANHLWALLTLEHWFRIYFD
jgi:asparagine synthase (glutamine-hydrolysing)